MKNFKGITYVGVDDLDLDLFEGQYVVPEGMSYNSYVITDEKIAVMDAVDKAKIAEWLGKLEDALQGRTPDYLVISHMEPDHSAGIAAFAAKYPSACVVGNTKMFEMFRNFYGCELPVKLTVKEGDTLSLGTHELTFVSAPMVHWPEVTVSYEKSEKVLFAADAFGKFGALQNETDDWACEARRYYFNIVGKYGAQVQALLKNSPLSTSRRYARCTVPCSRKIFPITSDFTTLGAAIRRRAKARLSRMREFTATPEKPRSLLRKSSKAGEKKRLSRTWRAAIWRKPSKTRSAMTRPSLPRRLSTAAFSPLWTTSSATSKRRIFRTERSA